MANPGAQTKTQPHVRRIAVYAILFLIVWLLIIIVLVPPSVPQSVRDWALLSGSAHRIQDAWLDEEIKDASALESLLKRIENTEPRMVFTRFKPDDTPVKGIVAVLGEPEISRVILIPLTQSRGLIVSRREVTTVDTTWNEELLRALGARKIGYISRLDTPRKIRAQPKADESSEPDRS